MYLALPANGNQRNLQRTITASSRNGGRLKDRIFLISRRESLHYPRPMIVRRPSSFFQAIDCKAHMTAGGEQLAIRRINIPRKVTLNHVSRLQLRKLQRAVQLYFNVEG